MDRSKEEKYPILTYPTYRYRTIKSVPFSQLFELLIFLFQTMVPLVLIHEINLGNKYFKLHKDLKTLQINKHPNSTSNMST